MIDFKVLFNGSPNCYVVLQPDFTIVEANEAYLRVTGRQRGELIGQLIFDAFPDPDPDRRRQLRDSLQRVLDRGGVDVLALIPYSIPIAGESGTVFQERYWSATHTPVFGADGRIAYILQHTVDVTELHALRAPPPDDALPPHARMESSIFARAQVVQAANRRMDVEIQLLRRLFEQAPGFMCYLHGPDFVFEMANSACRRLVGERPVLGRTAREVLPEIEGQKVLRRLSEVMREARPYIGRGRRLLLDNAPGAGPEEFFLDFVLQPVVEADGSVSGIVVQGQDITQQKRSQDELQRYRDSLENQVEERTRQLSELAGYLQKVSEAEKNHLSRELHDELGALLTAIMIDVYWARGRLRDDPAAADEKLGRALGHLEQGIALKRRIIENLRPSIIFHLGLSEALAILGEEAAERNGWSVDLDLTEDLPPLKDDIAVALYRIAQEALTNASKYSQARRIGLMLWARDGWIELEVWDDGRGFDLERQRRDAVGRHGLIGMQQRVVAFAGTLEVDTEPGKGVRILARIPDDSRNPGVEAAAGGPAAGDPV